MADVSTAIGAALRSPASSPAMAVKAKDAEKLLFFEEMTSNVDAVQERVLAEILGRNADTEYLKNCGLGGATGSPSLPPNTKPASNQLQGMATETGAAATFGEVHGAEHLPNGALILGKSRAAELGALYSSAAAGFAPRENGMPFGEALLGKNRIVGLAAPYSNAAVFAHPRGMAAGEALRPTPGPPYVAQVSIDEVMGAKVGGPIAVGTNAAGADAGDVLGSGGNLPAFVGIVAVSSAVTTVAAGAVSPAVAFGFFVILLGGLSLAMSAVRGA